MAAFGSATEPKEASSHLIQSTVPKVVDKCNCISDEHGHFFLQYLNQTRSAMFLLWSKPLRHAANKTRSDKEI